MCKSVCAYVCACVRENDGGCEKKDEAEWVMVSWEWRVSEVIEKGESFLKKWE